MSLICALAMADIEMKSLELLGVGIRLMGIYTLITALRYSIELTYRLDQYGYFLHQQDDFGIIFIGAETLLLILASFAMMRFPLTIAAWLLPKSREDEAAIKAGPKDVERILYSVIGLYFIVSALPDLVQNALSWWYFGHAEGGIQREKNRYMIYEIATIIEIGLGLYLLLRTEGLMRVLQKFRTAGVR